MAKRLERFYIACVAFIVGAAGTAVGFTFGIVPYYGATDASVHDKFFAVCVAVGTLIGFAIGLANGVKLSRASQPSSTTQRRLLSYIRRRGNGNMPQRTIHRISVQPLGQRQV
ncbi:MAG TPA: hypothetical protein VEV38_04325 [Candidatus Eremiobacteraceae bacterium]|nr:hypothetical protein [Candidatus Eremiobacteraceae bacterium]